MRTFFLLIIIVVLINNIKAQFEYKNFNISANASNIYYSSKYRILSEVDYSPKFGFGGGIDFSYPLSEKVILKFPLAYEQNRVSNIGLFAPYYFHESQEVIVRKNNIFLGFVSNYNILKNIEFGLGPAINYNVMSHIVYTDSVYTQKYNVSKFKFAYLFNLEFKQINNPIFFIRFKQCFDLRKNVFIKEYDTVLFIGIKFNFKNKGTIE